MISSGKSSFCKEDIISKISEAEILGYYLGIKNIPTLINSPIRKDDKPSLGLYSPDGISINYIDFATGDRGNCISLLMRLWNINDKSKVFEKIFNELIRDRNNIDKKKKSNKNKVRINKGGNTELLVKIREWRTYDIKYWESYGVSLEWLKFANVFPISYKFIIKDNIKYTFPADKYAYAFIENKEGKTTYKIYQPYNKTGFKWISNHDKSVLALWTQMPEKGNSVCICSSVKDALCLMNNVRIPAIALQGEAYPISDTAINVLKSKFKNIYICLDNDEAGKKDAKKLMERTNFINVEIPQFEGGKDISDYYKVFGKEKFIDTFIGLFKNISTS